MEELMKKILTVLILFICATSFAQTQNEAKTYSTYKDLYAKLIELYNGKNYLEAAVLAENHLAIFPEKTRQLTYNMAFFYTLLGNYDNAIKALNYGHNKGIFYGVWDFFADQWKPLLETSAGKDFLAENDKRVKAAQEKAELVVDISLPEGYDASKKYPLFIALHGGGENLAEFKPNWTSPIMKKDYIVAYLQSTQVASMTGFHWQDNETTKKDISKALYIIKKKHLIDEKEILMGGFSSGGYGSMIIAFSNTIPVKGLILLCPPVPDVTNEQLSESCIRGLRVMMLTTELDNRIEQQKELVARLQKSNIAAKLEIFPNIGHWYPNDLPEKIDNAIKFINGQ
jgi:predicted esterase